MKSWLIATYSVAAALCAETAIAVPNSRLLDTEYDVPALRVVDAGVGKISLEVTAGSRGAPLGFTVLWMTESDFLANGSRWYSTPDARQNEACFTGIPTVNSWGASSFRLPAATRATIEIGDLLDETGVTTTSTDELAPDTRWVFAAYANGDRRMLRSVATGPAAVSTLEPSICAFTRAQWARNPQRWPVSSLTLGNVLYGKTQLLTVLTQGPSTNGLVVLARQLIAAKLNVANGADDAAVRSAIADADALIGFLTVPPVGGGSLPPFLVRDLAQTLEDFNHGVGIPDPCVSTAVDEVSWGALKAAYR